MYICDRCGSTTESLYSCRRYHGVSGNSAMSGWYTEVEDECTCGGNYVEAVKCPICGDWVDPDECDGAHKDCYEKASHDLETVVKYAQNGDPDDLFILLTEYIFDKDSVVQILLKQARKEYEVPILKERMNKQLQNFTYGDISGFAEWVGENL